MEMETVDMPAPPPIIIAPFTPRETTHPTGLDSDSESPNGESAVMTPRSPSTLLEVVPDIPPSYEEAQAELLRAHSSDDLNTRDHSMAIGSDPLVSLPDQFYGSTPQVNRISTRRANISRSADANLDGPAMPNSPHDPTTILLHQALDFAYHPSDIEVRFAPRLSRRIAVPQQVHFVRAYSKALHAHGIRPAEFVAFIDGLNTLSSVSAALKPTTDDPPNSSQDLVPAYLHSANTAFFAPRGLKVSLQPLPTLLSSLATPAEPSVRAALLHKIRAVNTPIAEKVKALEPHIAPLTYSVPEFSAATLTLRVMASRLAPVPPEFVPLDPSDHTAAPPIPAKSPLRPRQRHDSAAEAWDEWGQRLGRYWGNWGRGIERRAEGWGRRAEDWGRWAEDRGVAFGKRTGDLSGEVGRRCEVWGEGLGRRVSTGNFLGRGERQWGGLGGRPRGSWDGGRCSVSSSPSAGELGFRRSTGSGEQAACDGAEGGFAEQVRRINAQALEEQERGKKPDWVILDERDKAIEAARGEKNKAEVKSQAKTEAKRAKRAAKEARRAEKSKVVERTRDCGGQCEGVAVEEVDKEEDEEEEEELLWIVVENLEG